MMEQGNRSMRRPNIQKLTLAILEHFIEPTLGKEAINEIKSPVKNIELQKTLETTLNRAEKRFISEFPDREISTALLSLPIASLESTKEAIKSYFDNPNDAVFIQFLELKILSDYPKLSKVKVQEAAKIYLQILREELIPISEELQNKLITLATLDIQNNTAQILNILNELKNITSLHEIPSPSEKFQKSRIKVTQKAEETEEILFETEKRIVTMGRAPDNDITIKNPTVSWYHGYIENVVGRYKYHHLSKSTPTIIRREGQEYLLSYKRLMEIFLQNYDRISVGDTIFVLYLDTKSGPTGYTTTDKSPIDKSLE